MQHSVSLPMHFKTFIVVVTLFSIFGGYQLSRLVYGMNDDYLQRTEKILAMERSLNDATVALGSQIQEWKDMLLRVDDTELYSKHRKAFTVASAEVQEALMRTKIAMKNNGMDTGEIEQLLGEHQSLGSDYVFAKSVLNPGQIKSYLETDKLVIGVDRKLQHHIAVVKTEIQRFSDQQLKKTMPEDENRYLLGFIGALSLLVMSLAGFIFASRFQGNKN